MHHFDMTPGYMTLTLGPRKNPRRKVAFLLEKTVEKILGPLIFPALCYDIVISRILTDTDQQNYLVNMSRIKPVLIEF